MKRTNAANTGKEFERLIEIVLTQYRSQNIMKVHKVDAPVKFAGRRVIFAKNPLLDYCGSWSCQSGRMIVFEAKSTSEPVLPLLVPCGLKVKQWDAMRLWKYAGAVVFMLWEFKGAVRFVIPEHIERALHERSEGTRPRRELDWKDWDGKLLKPGLGHVYFDIQEGMIWQRQMSKGNRG